MTKREVVKEITREVTAWMIKHRKPITSRSLRPILERHVTNALGLEELTDYLQSKAGRQVWHATMRDTLKR